MEAVATSIDYSTSGSTATVSNLSFKPKGMTLFARGSVAATWPTSSTQPTMHMGSGTSGTDCRSMGWRDQTGVTTTEIALRIQYGYVLGYRVPGANYNRTDIQSMDDRGFTLTYAGSGESTGTNGAMIGYLTFGDTLLERTIMIMHY